MSTDKLYFASYLMAVVVVGVATAASAGPAGVFADGGTARAAFTINNSGRTLTFAVDDSVPERLTLSLDCAGQLQLSGEDRTLWSLNPASVGRLTIRGDDRDNTLTVDFANGSPIPADGLVFDGVNRGTDFDVLEIVNAQSQTLVSKAVSGHDGTFEFVFAGGATAVLEYRNIEPVDMSGSTVTDIVLNLPSGDDNAELLSPSAGILRLQSTDAVPTFEMTDFAAPSNSLTINGGQGDDVITVTSLNPSFAADLSVNVETVIIDNTVAVGANNIAIAADAISVNAGLSGTGTLVITPATAGTSIGLGGGSGTLNLSAAALVNLQDGFSAVTIGDFSSGPIDILTVTLSDDVTLISNSTITDGTGADLSAPTVTFIGVVSPGQSPGVLNVVGDVTLGMDSSLVVEIGGSLPGETGSSHDQVSVSGTVTIGSNVALQLSSFGGYTPTGSEQFVIIANDSADAVVGTFAGQAEGSIIPNLLGSGLDAMITYQGGDGNDVVITVDVPVELQTFTVS